MKKHESHQENLQALRASQAGVLEAQVSFHIAEGLLYFHPLVVEVAAMGEVFEVGKEQPGIFAGYGDEVDLELPGLAIAGVGIKEPAAARCKSSGEGFPAASFYGGAVVDAQHEVQAKLTAGTDGPGMAKTSVSN